MLGAKGGSSTQTCYISDTLNYTSKLQKKLPTDNQYSDWKKYSATFLLEDIAVTGQTLQKI